MLIIQNVDFHSLPHFSSLKGLGGGVYFTLCKSKGVLPREPGFARLLVDEDLELPRLAPRLLEYVGRGHGSGVLALELPVDLELPLENSRVEFLLLDGLS